MRRSRFEASARRGMNAPRLFLAMIRPILSPVNFCSLIVSNGFPFSFLFYWLKRVVLDDAFVIGDDMRELFWNFSFLRIILTI